MEYQKKPSPSAVPAEQKAVTPQVMQPTPVDPALQRQLEFQKQLHQHTFRSVGVQRQVTQPVLRAASLYSGEVQRVAAERGGLQRQVTELGGVSPEAVSQALQRQQEAQADSPVIQKPKSVGDWVTVMRQQAQQAEGRRMGAKEVAQFTALQRQVASTLVQGFRADRQPTLQRYAEYAEHLMALQRHPVSGQVARAFMTMMPQSERPALQRAVDEQVAREALQRQQDQQALQWHSLQRQLAELEQEATQPVFERIQQRRGAGNPLPEAIQRHLEQGLNHDLSSVRIHDDAEADKLAKKVNAVAFTTGQDIYFRSGQFNPNSQSGLELLAHEVTHTVQQSKGRVGKGIDPDAGLESEARMMGRKLAMMKASGAKIGARKSVQRAPLTVGHLMQRVSGAALAKDPAEIAKLEKQLKQLNADMALTMTQAAADVAGIVDPTPISDGISAAISLYRGDFLTPFRA